MNSWVGDAGFFPGSEELVYLHISGNKNRFLYADVEQLEESSWLRKLVSLLSALLPGC